MREVNSGKYLPALVLLSSSSQVEQTDSTTCRVAHALNLSTLLQETFLQFGRDYLARNYSVLVYEGPGQGVVIKNPPYMPFYPQWENVLQAILNSVQQNLAQYVQMDKIVQNGGWLVQSIPH